MRARQWLENMTDRLTEEDVRRLLADGSGSARAKTAETIAADYEAGVFNAKEIMLAEEIFRLMARDAEVRVREALSQTLKENRNLPHDVALALASDIDRVALPVIEFSDVLTEVDLLAIVRAQGAEKQVAVARRKAVPETVSNALVESGNERAVVTLVANDGAVLSEAGLERVVDLYGYSDALQDAIVHRPNLPIGLSERLLGIVSERLREELAKFQALPDDLATDLILQARERAIIGLSTEADEVDVEVLVRQLHENGRLTGSLIVRAGCMGDLTFIEAAMAQLVGLPLMNARKLIHDSGTLGLDAIYKKSGLPLDLYPVISAAVHVADDTDYDSRPDDRVRYRRRILERVLTQYEDIGMAFQSDDLSYLFDKFSQMPLSVDRSAA